MFNNKNKTKTMKKIYQVPALTIVRVGMTPILAGSPGYGGETEQTNGNLSRRGGDIWDDEDEEY